MMKELVLVIICKIPFLCPNFVNYNLL